MKKEDNDTEQKILAAAIKEFSAKGFDGARTTTIASDAGVTHAMLHYYFRTKEKLFERVFQDKIQHLMKMVFGVLSEPGSDLKDRIRNGVEYHFDFLLANSELPPFIVNTLNTRPELFSNLNEEIAPMVQMRLRALQEEFDRSAQRGETAPVDVKALITDTISLNLLPFLAYRLIMPIMGYKPEEYDNFMKNRKRENVETILRRISPTT